jgi:hypothetical protein
MNKTLLISLSLFFSIASAEVVDVIVKCHNLKGELIAEESLRVDKQSLLMYKEGGFTVTGRSITIVRKKEGFLAEYIPCAAKLNSGSSKVLTCATGSTAEILDKLLPVFERGTTRCL